MIVTNFLAARLGCGDSEKGIARDSLKKLGVDD